MEEQKVTITLERYTELIKSEQRANQYKKFLLSNAHNNRNADILTSIEEKDIFTIMNENKKINKNEREEN